MANLANTTATAIATTITAPRLSRFIEGEIYTRPTTPTGPLAWPAITPTQFLDDLLATGAVSPLTRTTIRDLRRAYGPPTLQTRVRSGLHAIAEAYAETWRTMGRRAEDDGQGARGMRTPLGVTRREPEELLIGQWEAFTWALEFGRGER